MTTNLPVDPARIAAVVEGLAALTEPDRPFTRRAFTPMFLEGRAFLETRMREAGLDTRIDAAGNLIGRRAGRRPGLGTIMVGSHSDTVPSGGRFDGIAGVAAGLEVARALDAAGVGLALLFSGKQAIRLRPRDLLAPDVPLLNYALTLEHLENAFYRDGLEQFSDDELMEAEALLARADREHLIAVYTFQESLAALEQGARSPVVVTHTLTEADVSGPFEELPDDVYERADQPCLCYEDQREIPRVTLEQARVPPARVVASHVMELASDVLEAAARRAFARFALPSWTGEEQ